MIHAYDSQYLDDAMRNMGEMMDYIANSCFMDMDEFFYMFIASGFADQFSSGSPKYISGMSGTELAIEVLNHSGVSMKYPEPQDDDNCSPEYWCGWIVAYYQWYTGISFKEFSTVFSFRETRKLYPTLHEAAEEKFVDTVNKIVRRKNLPTKLCLLRQSCGLTQRELSEKSDVPIRTIQQYESRARDINRAAAETVAALASVIGCTIEDLLEYKFEEVVEI